jgi:hypothetical protein
MKMADDNALKNESVSRTSSTRLKMGRLGWVLRTYGPFLQLVLRGLYLLHVLMKDQPI